MPTVEILEGFDDDSYLDFLPSTPTGSTTTGEDSRGRAFTLSADWRLLDSTVAIVLGFRFLANSSADGVIAENWTTQYTGGGYRGWTLDFDYASEELYLRGSGGTFPGNLVDTVTGVTADEWHYVELYMSAMGSNSGTAVLNINGNEEYNGTIDTRFNGGSNELDLKSGVTYDDLYLLTDATNSDFLGPVFVERMQPTADGTLTDWTGSYLDVDDDRPDNGSSIESSTTGHQSTFEMGGLSGTIDSVKLVRHELYVEGVGSVESIHRTSGGTVTTVDTFTAPGDTTWSYFTTDMFNDPATASAWVKADFEAAEFGVERG